MNPHKPPESRSVDKIISEMVASYDDPDSLDDLDTPNGVPVKPRPHQSGGATAFPEICILEDSSQEKSPA